MATGRSSRNSRASSCARSARAEALLQTMPRTGRALQRTARELVRGELSSFGQAALPAVAAVGGMLVPALIYVAINFTIATNLVLSGAEALVTDSISVGLEYLYNRYRDNKYNVVVSQGTAPVTNPFILQSSSAALRPSDRNFDFHSLRATVGFQF